MIQTREWEPIEGEVPLSIFGGILFSLEDRSRDKRKKNFFGGEKAPSQLISLRAKR